LLSANDWKLMSSIPFFDYKNIFEPYRARLHGILDDILDRGAFIMQKDVFEFESDLAEFCGAKHALGVGNCTDGLRILLQASGIQPGDEVLISSHTFIATASAVHYAGGKPIPVDIGPDGLFDASQIAKSISPKTRWVMPTQLNGRVADMGAIRAEAQKFDLRLVEDAAQALGATFGGQSAGTFGEASAFSFYPAKLLGALGDAGAIVTNDDALATEMRLLRDHGRSATGEVTTWGHNSRLDNLQAAFLKLFLADLPEAISRRRELARRYCDGLSGSVSVQTPERPSESGMASDAERFDVFQNFEIQTERRDDLRAFLTEKGIGTLVQWAGWPVHKNKNLGFTEALPETDRYYEKCLMLPMHVALSDEHTDRVIEAVLTFHQGA
jgi:dTDP-4-amino-4,6-dideoxygalactose transaminase